MTSFDDGNKRIYESAALARQYAQDQSLQPPEQAILEIVRGELAPQRMLDVGVGGGRTTAWFAPLVAEYAGIDYSQSMIDACHARFREAPGKVEFQVADVRSMPMYGDGRFDFVLFSYNGIDYISGATRAQAFLEIHRVTRKGGYFAFSSHNLNNLERRLQWQWRGSLKATASSIRWMIRLRRHNPGLRNLADANGVEVNDGALNFQLLTWYQRPKTQVAELQRVGFEDIRILRLSDGRKVESEQELERTAEDWLYYLCRKA